MGVELMNKRYSELIQIPTFEGRFEYLKLHGGVGYDTFGSNRFLNQDFYSSREWRNLRNKVITRDCGYDMALNGFFAGHIMIHHINPITVDDFENDSSDIWDLENLVCVDRLTHNAIHYGDINLVRPVSIVIRTPGDTTPWR
jgi:hypothetical protein